MATTRVRMQADRRRDLIVAEAAHVFAERRYDDVSTTELAQACGVSRGLLSHYFATKRDLYLAVVGRLVNAPRIPVPAYVEGATVEDRIARSVEEWVDMVLARKDAWLAVSGFLGESRDGEISTILDDYIERMVDQICELGGLHEVREHPTVRTALHGYSAFATTVTQRWLLGAEASREHLEQMLRDTLVSLVRVTVPAVIQDSGPARPGPVPA